MDKAVGYISSHKKNNIERDIELKVQKERIKEYCVNNELECIEIYEEPRESTEDYKSELFRLLDNSRQNKFQQVIVLNLDRIGYDIVAKVWVTNELKKNGVRLHSLTENMSIPVGSNDKVQEKAETIKDRVKDIPSLPEIVNKVINLVQNPNSSALQLSKIIANDAGLTARVLKLVNSAYYGFPKQISSIQHAIAILGFSTIRGLVLSSSIFKIFAPKDNASKLLDYKKLWRHSLLTATINKHVNNALKYSENENLFSSAILHDMGKIILDQYDHGNYVLSLAENSELSINDDLECEKKYCGLDHCEVGHLIAEHWNLPETITEAIKYHHSPKESMPEHKKIVTMTAISNIFAHAKEMKFDLEPEFFKNIELEVLNLTLEDVFDLFNFIKEKLLDDKELEEFLE